MTKKNSTKKALMMSVLSLLLCFSMLLGTTFAWFTDSVTSANNIIMSGNLDVELYYQVEGQRDWTKVTETTNIFKEGVLWEPGHTEVVKLKVVNEGTLALKYNLGVNVASEVGSVNVEGDPFMLSDHIRYGIVNGAQSYTRDEAIAAAENAGTTALKTAYNSGTTALDAKNDTDSDEKIVTMVVYMPTSVGNEANHAKGAATPTINLGLTLFATQQTVESDAFGPDFDADAPITSAPVTRPSAGNQIVLNSSDDENLVEIVVPSAIVDALPATVTSVSIAVSEPIVDAAANTITFASIEIVDQNGVAVDLEALGVDERINITLPAQTTFAPNEPVAIYHDGELIASAVVDANGVISYDAAHLCEVTVGAFETLEKNNDGVYEISSALQLFSFAQMVNDGKDFKGEMVVLTKDIDLNNAAWTPIGNFTYDITTNGDGYVLGRSFKGTFDGQGHKISNLYVNAPETSGVGLFGYVADATVTDLTIENADLYALSHVAAFVAKSTGASTVTDCDLIGDIDINAYWAYVAGIVGKADTISIDNCTVTPNGVGVITSENRNAVGSILAWMVNGSTVSNCEAQDLRLTGWANIGAISGFVNNNGTIANCSAKNITLTKTRVDGIGTIGLVAGGWSGRNITVKDNTFDTITVNGNMVPHASVNILFGGEFSGTVHNQDGVNESNNTQTNITDNRVQAAKDAASLAAALANGGKVVMIADIDLGGSIWTPVEVFSGTFDGNGYTINGLTVSGVADAALINTIDEGTVKNLKFTNVNIEGKNAGVVAISIGGGTVENVHVLSGSVNGTSYAAAFAGQQAYYGATIKNCTNYANITSGYIAAGFGGYIWYDSVVENCVNYGNIIGGNRAGGIAAHAGGVFTKCVNNGDVIGNGAMPAGGIAAVLGGASTFEGCVNNGNVTNNGSDAYNSQAAGILGQAPSAGNSAKTTIKNCINNGVITAASSNAAGIAVSHYGSLSAVDCENNGDVYGKTGAAGTVADKGMFSGVNTVTNCVNNGDVTVG